MRVPLQVYQGALEGSVRAAFSAVTEELCSDSVDVIAGTSDAGQCLHAAATASVVAESGNEQSVNRVQAVTPVDS